MPPKKRVGRKATGRKRSTVFSTRMDPVLHKMLVESAQANSGGNVSLELEKMLHRQFRERKQATKGRPLRALCFIIERVARAVVSHDWIDPLSEDRINHWRTDPFHYRAFEIAVAQILKALRPPGEIVPPHEPDRFEDFATAYGLDASGVVRKYINDRYSSPNRLADYAATGVWLRLYWMTDLTEGERWQLQEGGQWADLISEEYYGMKDAQKDLGIEPTKSADGDDQ